MKILLFGKSGQVGWELQRALAPLGEVVAPGRADVELCGDLNDPEGVARTIAQVRPAVVVNAAAYTAVDQAEGDCVTCSRINALAPEAMAREAERLGAWFVHYSTDYVFDGAGERAWREDDAIAPLNVYGSSKADGERRVAAACSRRLVFRTSWVFADRGNNFMRTMLRLGQERDTVSVVDDQFGAPTGAELIADVSAHALRCARHDASLAGLYHLAASGTTSWFGYAQHVFAQAAAGGRARGATLAPTPSSAWPTVARRPHNSRLDCSRLQQAFGLHLPPWQRGVERAVARLTG